MRQKYVVGFATTYMNDEFRILLIRKNRPEWQKGRLNGVGGKIESIETPLEAMIREFSEETSTRLMVWQERLILSGLDFRVHFFVSFITNDVMFSIRPRTDENLEIVTLSSINDKRSDSRQYDVIDNLNWIIPICLDIGGPLEFPVRISEEY